MAIINTLTALRSTRESARLLRFEPDGTLTATNVQNAIEQVDAEAGGKVSKISTARLPVAAASVPILTSDIEVGIDATTTPVSCPLPDVAAWAAANPNGLELTIFDLMGQAATNAITPVLNGTDIFIGDSSPAIVGNYGLLKLRPVLTGGINSWYVRGIN